MKICLVIPPRSPDVCNDLSDIFPSLGLLSLATVSQKGGHEVKIIDCLIESLDNSGLEEKLRELKPDVIGVSIMASTGQSGLMVCQVAKKIDKNILTVLGGHQATFLSRLGSPFVVGGAPGQSKTPCRRDASPLPWLT